MGLLDFMGSSVDDPKTSATLALAQGLLTGRSGMTGLLGGMQGYVGTMAQAKQQEEQRKQEELKRQLLMAQIGETQAQAAQRQAETDKLAQAQKRAAAFQSALSPQGLSPTQAASAPGGPTQANAAMIGARKPTDWGALAQQFPDQVDLIKKLAESSDFGRSKVARTVKGIGPDGKEYEYQVDEFGRRVGDGLAQYRAPIQADTGGAVNFLDPYSLAKIGQLGKSQTPDGAASNGLGYARLNFEKSKDARDQTNPPGGKYEYKQDANGNWMALPKEVNPGAPIQPVPVIAPNKNVEGAKRAVAIIDQAGPLIDKATSSYLGQGVDFAGRIIGKATDGAIATSQLKALEGALMMAQPRMEGPQSDKDVALYRQMAGQIGDPTVPAPQKHAALAEIRKLHERYTGGMPAPAPQSTGAPTMRWNPKTGTFDMIGG